MLHNDIALCELICTTHSSSDITLISLQVYILTKQEGGRHTPFVTNYQPQMFTRTADISATIELPEGKEIVMPGDDTELIMMLNPATPLEASQRFTLRESHKTIGTGVVTQIIA